MAEYDNQHYVPQFYFRRFTRGRKCVNLVLKDSGQIILYASIKHQCADHRFYGSTELERLFNTLEGRHSHALRVIADAACNADWSALTPEILGTLWEAVLFQHNRTALEVEKSKDVPNAMALPAFRNHLATAPAIENRESILAAIDNGEVKIVHEREYALAQSIEIALESVLLISDLDFCVLRNLTDYPFVFSDSPVVFYNTARRKVTSRGVLGLQSPGLQIFFPLSRDMVLMLYDDAAYGLSHNNVIDITARSDVSQLNALQFKHSLNSVYFADAQSQEYVSQLWRAYGRNARLPADEVRVLHGVEIDGKIEPNPVTLFFQPHLDVQLELSFITCEQAADSGKFAGHRSPELVMEHKARLKQADGDRDD